MESHESFYWLPQNLSEVNDYETEYSFEWKRYLLLKNAEEIKESVNLKKRFSFYSPNIVKTIFNMCKMFKQPPEVRYLAVDVFDRFLVKHFVKVKETFEQMENVSSALWDTIIERILDQSPLRILSSVQLAMKYSWSCNILTATDIQEIMKFLGHEEVYQKRSIFKSEARIYQHINFNASKIQPFISTYEMGTEVPDFHLAFLNSSF